MQAVSSLSLSKVALSSGGNRRTNLTGVLQNIDSQIQWQNYNRIIIKPNLTSTTIQLASTHIEATRTLIAHIRQRVDGEIWLIEGGATQPRLQGFINFGYEKLIEEFDVTLQEIGEGETAFLEVFDRQLRPIQVKVDSRVLCRNGIAASPSDFIISITPPKVHNCVIFTGALKNAIMGALIIDNMSSPERINRNLKKRIAKKIYYWYKKVFQKLPKAYKNKIHNVEIEMALLRTFKEGNSRMMMHQGFPVMNLNLFLAARHLRPHLAIIDGFEGIEGDGPIHGTPVHLGFALAGTDSVAVDATAARIMGIDPETIGYLYYCNKYGLGHTDSSNIELVGMTSFEHLIKPVELHPTFNQQIKWRSKQIEQLIEKLSKKPGFLEKPGFLAVVLGETGFLN